MQTLNYTLQCNDCKSAYRLTTLGPTVVAGAGSYCPKCGSSATKRTHRTGDGEDYWWILAPSIGLPQNETGAQITKLLYDQWDTVKYRKFVDFVKAFESEPTDDA